MKKLAITVAGIAVLLLAASCKKDKKDTPVDTKPVISWEANSSFGQTEIKSDMDATLTISVTEGVQAFTLKFTSLPADLLGVVKQHIGTTANRTGGNANTPVMDVVDDATVAGYLSGLGIASGSSLRGKTGLSFDFNKLIQDILKNQVLENNSIISIQLAVVDQSDQSVSKTISFHYTSGPALTWDGNADFADVNLNTYTKGFKFKLNVPGKISLVTIQFDTKASVLTTVLRNYTSSSSALVLDLINDSKTISQLAAYKEILTGSNLAGKTSATLDLSDFIVKVVKANLQDNETCSLTINVEDALGKSATNGVVLNKPASAD